MKERPILFSGEMIRAILEGRKTMTRRGIKPSKYFHTQCDWYMPHSGGGWWGHDGPYPDCIQECGGKGFDCPYGVPGDRLWVRETWAVTDQYTFTECEPCEGNDVWYKADNNRPDWAGSKWRPSIFMPRWASRVTLGVKDVRVERVQDISESDAEAEGIESLGGYFTLGKALGSSNKEIFADLWDSINAKRGYGWDTNPWVWVIEFKPIEK